MIFNKEKQMIRVYPTKIEAYDEQSKSVVFTIEAIDVHCAEINMKQAVTNDNIDNITAAMRRSVAMLELIKGSKS